MKTALLAFSALFVLCSNLMAQEGPGNSTVSRKPDFCILKYTGGYSLATGLSGTCGTDKIDERAFSESALNKKIAKKASDLGYKVHLMANSLAVLSKKDLKSFGVEHICLAYKGYNGSQYRIECGENYSTSFSSTSDSDIANYAKSYNLKILQKTVEKPLDVSYTFIVLGR